MSLRTITVTLSLFLVATTAFAKSEPLKVFVLFGQSNMQGHADVRTLVHLNSDSTTKTFLEQIQGTNGNSLVHKNVWISYLTDSGVKQGQLTTGYGANEKKIGPELMFGITMQKRVDQPILLIKTAWGGKSVHTDFRSPGSGEYEFEAGALKRFQERGNDVAKIQKDKKAATGVYYRKTVEHVKAVLKDIKNVYPEYDAAGGYEIAGIVWFQGWNDMVDSETYPKRGEPGGYDKYSQWLAQLIKDLRSDLDASNAPFVIGVMGVGGPTRFYSREREKKIHQSFRDAMAAAAEFPELKGNVFTVKTEDSWDMELDALVKRDDKLRGDVRRANREKKLVEMATKIYGEGEALDKFKSLRPGRQQNKLVETLQRKEFSDQELDVLKNGKSNAAYHYLGSAKIMTRIGDAFAKAIPLDEK